MLESVHPSNQVKSPLFPSICSTPGEVSAPSSPRCLLKKHSWGERFARGGKNVWTNQPEGDLTFTPSVIHHPPKQAHGRIKDGVMVLS